jgi:FkbM family methyltransferase
VTGQRISYAQNAEDIRVWRALRHLDQSTLTFVDVGANEPRHLSITASLHDLGWRGLLIEADPELADLLRVHRPGDTVVQMAAAAGPGELVFHRVPGTGLGTLDPAEAEAAQRRGFDVDKVVVRTDSIDAIMVAHQVTDVHFMSVDVEGAESVVLQGLSLHSIRPWILCVEAVEPGTSIPSHAEWEPHLIRHGYRMAAFDGVNRWYVADEHAHLIDDVAIPFNAVDAGEWGWVTAQEADVRHRVDRSAVRRAWQREVILNDIRGEVPTEEYEKQIHELRSALIQVEGSRTWRYAQKAARPAKALKHRAQVARQHLPGPLQRYAVRRRHLKHVTVNMGHLTHPALLAQPSVDSVGWITPDGLPEPPPAGLALQGFTAADAEVVRAWLADPHDSDAMLERRVDNHDDELGRARAALRLRLALAQTPEPRPWAGGDRVLVDARCLQTSAFGTRGIGRFARAALLAVRETIGDDRTVLLVDRGLEELPRDLAGNCRQVTRVSEHELPAYGVLVQPSPMTASARPLLPLLHSTAHKVAVVFDFIPMHHPCVYLADVASRAEYAAALDALRRYDEFVCISHVAATEVRRLVGTDAAGGPHPPTPVAWPRDVLPAEESRPAGRADGPIVVMTGDDARKNTFGGLAGVAAATAGEPTRDVVVIGMAGTGDRVHHWSIAAAMRPGEARTAERLSDEEMDALLRDASVVVVPSFDEGLSLPVIEALRAGAPVVASDIPAHRELIGAGSFLADPRSPASLAKAVGAARGQKSLRDRQLARLRQHQHRVLEDVVAESVKAHLTVAAVDLPAAPGFVGGRPLSIGIGAPWPPQRTGIADFTAATITELARLADVTVYTTANAEVTAPEGVRLRQGRIDDVIADGHDHDVFVTVVGNSHFHLPFIELLTSVDAVVLAHDTRLVELYLALRDRGGLAQVMLRGKGRRDLSPPLDEQIDDLRLLESTALWEVARRGQLLVGHTPTAEDVIAADTGVRMHLLPFANYRRPSESVITAETRRAARARLGLSDDFVHLASFGFVDTRTKLTDVVVEAAAWLTQWGHRVSLHLVGSAPDSLAQELGERAHEAGLAEFEITGFVDDAAFRDFVLGIDLGVQLRVSPLLGVSGPLSDMAAYGTPAVANRGVCLDVDTPAFIDRLPDDVSPVMVAEAIEHRLRNPWAADEVEAMRVDYLDRKSPVRYAADLHDLLLQVARGGS